MSTSPDQIVLTHEQQKRIALLSDETGRRWDELLDEALSTFRPPSPPANNDTPPETFFDRAKLLGLIGCVEGGPPDLSTNPIYMEGFGKSES
jgi:hypothetical protein